MADEEKEKKGTKYSTLSFASKGQIKDKNRSNVDVELGKTLSRSNVAIAKNYSRSNMGLTKSYSRVKMRKESYGFRGVPGIKAMDKSQMATEYKRPILSILPTYQLEPRTWFNCQRVKDTADAILDSLFTDHKYNVTDSPALAIRVAGELMRQVKALDFNRYRIISIVTLGQKRAQSYNNAVSFLWDHERDNYVDINRANTSCFIQVTLFGVYLD